MTVRAAQLAKRLPDDVRPLVLGSIVALGDRYLSEEDKKRLLEVLSMTEIEQWIREKYAMEMAKAALRKGYPVDDVINITGLTRETVLRLKDEVEQERLQAVSQ